MKKGLMMVLMVIVILGNIIINAAAEDSEAVRIIQKIDEQSSAETVQSKMSMLIYPEAEDDDFRDFKLISYGKGDDESYMEFLSPRSIKGLRVLSREDGQWVYFPSTGRVRKIGGAAKSQSVRGVGGDFSYEDLGGGNFGENYSVMMIEDNREEWIIKGLPKDKASSYSYVLLYVEKDGYHPIKTEFYDKEGLIKTLFQQEYRTFGGHETACRLIMMNHREESKTIIIIHEAVYNTAIPDRFFNAAQFFK